MHLVVKELCPNTVEQQTHPEFRVNEKGYVNLGCESPSGANCRQHMVTRHQRMNSHRYNPQHRHEAYTLTAACGSCADCRGCGSARCDALLRKNAAGLFQSVPDGCVRSERIHRKLPRLNRANRRRNRVARQGVRVLRPTRPAGPVVDLAELNKANPTRDDDLDFTHNGTL